MKQIQFEVRNVNDMRRELARAKRIAKNNEVKQVAFQIFTQLTSIDEIKELTDVIEQEIPRAMYYGCQSFGNIFQGQISTKKTVVVCTLYEYETSKAEAFIVAAEDENSKYKSLNDIWEYCNQNSWVKAVEIITTFNASLKLGLEKPLDNLREDIQVFGGISINPEDIFSTESYVFSKDFGFSKNASLVVVLGGEDLYIQCSFVRGWEGLGKSFTITECEGDLIKKIDDEPPMEIYKKYLDIDTIDNLQMKAIQFPLLVEVDGIECIRQPFANENDDSLRVLVGVENGMKVRLSYGDKQTIVKTSKKAQAELMEFSPEFIRIFSCASRLRYLGDDKSSKENSYFEDIAPTVGFYTRGEILRVRNYLHLFNSTLVYVMAREGEKVAEEYYLEDNSSEDNEILAMIPNLINYISAVTNDLEGQFMGAMSGMASVYKNLFIIDTENEEITQLDNSERATDLLAQKEYYRDKFYYFIDNIIVDEYKELAEIFFNLDTLPSRLKARNLVNIELVGRNVGWFRAQFVVINRDKDGVPNRYVFTTRVIDDERKEAEEKQKIIDKLADTYYTMHLFDLETGKCKEIDTVEMLHNVYKENVQYGGQHILVSAMKATAVPEHLDTMLEFTDFSTLEERMKDKKFIAIVFKGVTQGWAKAQFIEYERNSDGKLSKVLFVTQIVDEEKRREEELEKKSTIDELTGLLNRRAYEEAVKEISGDDMRSVVIASLDVNGLKAVNDDIGHTAGDELLQGAAEVLLRCLKPYGKVFRIGGDEFSAIIFANEDELARIQKDLDNTMVSWKGKEVDNLSISYGFVSSVEYPDSSFDELEVIADKRMYESKEQYYKNGGIDRRSQQQLYDILCKSYIKILSVNLTTDDYKIIKTDESEMRADKGYCEESLSKWIFGFVESGQIHEDDKANFLAKTDIEVLRKYFKDHDDFIIAYRRKSDNGYINVFLELTKTDKYTDENMDIFLYVKKIGE